MVVFPSNRTLCERLNGMPCSTMRRHLARLVAVGLLIRRDSPNGKRYSRKDGAGRVAFGFDLSGLYRRAEEIARAAEAVREAEDRLRRLRETVSLMRRDLAALATLGEETCPGAPLWPRLRGRATQAAKALRRKLMPEALEAMRDEMAGLLEEARDALDASQAEDMNTNAADFGQHHLSSNKDLFESELALKQGKAENPAPDAEAAPVATAQSTTPRVPSIPLHLVIKSCPSVANFYQGPIRHWHQLHAAACYIRPTMDISPSAWDEAQHFMGPEQAAVVVLAMLERFSEIRSPGGYLRTLTKKAAEGQFSCGPMIMALIKRQGAA